MTHSTLESSNARSGNKAEGKDGSRHGERDPRITKPTLTLQGNSSVHDFKGLTEVILERRATTHFKDEEIPPNVIDFVLRLAGQAPSGYNLQPWRFVVVQTQEGKKRLRKAAMDQEKITEAPLVVIAVGMKKEPISMAEDILSEGAIRGVGEADEVAKTAAQARKFLSEFPMDVWVNRHTMIAVTFMMLAAEACGLDTAPMEGFDASAVKREFGVPEEGEIVALLAIGRGKEPDKAFPGRLSLSRIAYHEHFGKAWEEQPSEETAAKPQSDSKSSQGKTH